MLTPLEMLHAAGTPMFGYTEFTDCTVTVPVGCDCATEPTWIVAENGVPNGTPASCICHVSVYVLGVAGAVSEPRPNTAVFPGSTFGSPLWDVAYVGPQVPLQADH